MHERENLVDSQEPSGEAPGTKGTKGSESGGALGKGRGNVQQRRHYPAAQLRSRWPFLAMVSPVGGSECVSEHLGPPAVQMLPTRPIPLSLPPEC